MGKKSLRAWLNRALFQPKPIDILFNPFYITRRKLFIKLKLILGQEYSTVLDFGCGEKPYYSLFKSRKYIGIDIQESGHNNSNSAIDVYYDGKVLPFPDKYFDCVFASEVFEHVFNLDEVLSEIRRVLSDDGNLIVTIPFAWPEHEQPYDFGRYTTFALESIFEKAGMEIIESYKTGSYVSVLGQLVNNYIYMRLFPKNPYFRVILSPLLAPITGLTLFFDLILPRDLTLYHNHILKIKNIT